MKKILFLNSLLIIHLSIFGQLQRSGSLASETWNQEVHITANAIIGNNVTITILPGVTVKLYPGVSLTTTGSGVLLASGNASNKIIFTAFNGTSWGHLLFYNTTAVQNSILAYCIIEKGNAKNLSPNFGGGVFISSAHVEISHSIFRNNTASYGGGIFIQAYSSAISNCEIHNNVSDGSGGGIVLYSSPASILKNCIIYSNTSNGGGGGGGIFLSGCLGVKIINTIIVNNIASKGSNIRLNENTGAIRPSFINCIIWNPANSISYSANQLQSTNDFINCAIQNPTAGSITNCISLNAVNTDLAGPNFVATDGSDWSLRGNSPCIDKGLDPISDPDIPSTDIEGNTRVGPTDIGVYESDLLYTWEGDDTSNPTIWNDPDNWDSGVIPLGHEGIVVPSELSNYPTGSVSQDYIIGSGRQMTIEPGARVTLGSLTNNGTLKLNANASALSSLILNSYSKGAGAAEEIQLRITGGYMGEEELNQGKWHYISSPVQTFPIDPIFTTTTYNLAQWIDGIQGAGSIREGWVAYDGYIYITGGFNPAYEFSALTPGKGYNLWYDNDTTYTISGNLNYVNVPALLNFAGVAYNNGYNLLGNPFPSGLDWDYIVENTNYPYPQNTSQGIIFTKDDELYYYTGGVIVPDIGTPGTSPGVIPPMQGFFVKTYSTGNIINLTPDARTHDGIPPRYKGKAEIPLLRFAISENDITDETVVRFAENAKPGVDYAYDAVKMITSAQKTAIYTSSGTTNYAINGQPFPESETEIEIPLTVNLITDGNHNISLKQLQALDKYDLSLVDKSTGFSVDLSTNSTLAFSSPKGLIKDRFVIKIGNISTGIEDSEKGDNQFNIYNGFGLINIQTISDEWDGKRGSVRIMDMSGKAISDIRNTDFSKTSVTQIQSPVANGLYFIEIKSGVNRFVGKVMIK